MQVSLRDIICVNNIVVPLFSFFLCLFYYFFFAFLKRSALGKRKLNYDEYV